MKPIAETLRSSLLKLAYSNVWIALHGAAHAVAVAAILGLPLVSPAPAIVFLAVFFVYTFDKAVRFDPLADAVNDPERTAFLMRWRRPLVAAGFAALAGGALWSALHGLVALGLFLLPPIMAVLYAVRWLPRSFRYRRLKDIPWGKSLTVGISWGVYVVLMPAQLLGGMDQPVAVTVLVLWAASRQFVNTAYFDMGDLVGDRLEGVATIPVVIGFFGTRTLLMLINIAGMALLVGSIWLGVIPAVAYGAVASGLYVQYYVWAARSEQTDIGFLCDVVADGEHLTTAALTLGLLALLSA